MRAALLRGRRLFLQVAEALQSPLLLLVRLYWGWQFAQTGYGKFHNMPRVVDFLAGLGIPFPAWNARFIASLELAGGLLLMLGLGARPMSALLTISMMVAFYTADRDALFAFLSDPDKFMGAAPFTFLLASLLILAFGPGRVSLDAWIACNCYAGGDAAVPGTGREPVVPEAGKASLGQEPL